MLTVNGSAVTDCLLFDRQPIYIDDAGHDTVLLHTHEGAFWTVDLPTGTLHKVGYSHGDLMGPAAMSPDATQAVVGRGTPGVSAAFWLYIVDLATGHSRAVLRIGIDDYNRASLWPVRWLPAGIVLTPGVWDGPRRRLLLMNPATGALSQMTAAQFNALSPSLTFSAADDHVELGDDPFNGQGLWPNRLTLGRVGGPATVVASHKDRAFSALDVSDGSALLYAADDAPLSTARPAADMGLYLYANGAAVKQFGEDRVGEWQAAAFVGSDTAIAAKQLSYYPSGSVELILVSLCSVSGCKASATPIYNAIGPSPSVRFLTINA